MGTNSPGQEHRGRWHRVPVQEQFRGCSSKHLFSPQEQRKEETDETGDRQVWQHRGHAAELLAEQPAPFPWHWGNHWGPFILPLLLNSGSAPEGEQSSPLLP